ncbi:MAG: glycerol acyltransferase [Acidimicrobiales bacterium]|nr:glycerol acyltransferase [Hyphomonadaceae bacterium]RZV42301.1 MAG: glycerol acyltransferase [Acidimicrobiales bacterium]
MAKYDNDIVPELAPRAGNFITRAIGEAILKVLGWKMVGSLPNEKKLIIVGAPHTSNLDGILAVACMLSVGLKFSFMMKKEMFVFPFGAFFKALGAIPIDRGAKKNMVEQMADWFETHDKVWLGVTPEGTRKKVARYKKGYLYIAQAANVPVSLVGVNGHSKEVILGKVWTLTDDLDADNAAIKAYCDEHYSGVHPEKK